MQKVCKDVCCTCSPHERSYYLNFIGIAIGVILLIVGAIYLDQAVHSISGGYEDALCIAKAGENLTSDYCKYEDSQTGYCYKYVSCCDHPVMAYPKIQASNVSGLQLTMRARACATSNPCSAFYEWLKTDSSTTIPSTDKTQRAFPCKYNTARLVKNFESSNYCGLTRFQVFGPLESGTGWCGVVSSSAEYPTLQDADDNNQRLKPLWITLIVAGPCLVLACCLANRVQKPGDAAPPPASQAAASLPAPAHCPADPEPGPHPAPVPEQKYMAREELRQQSMV